MIIVHSHFGDTFFIVPKWFGTCKTLVTFFTNSSNDNYREERHVTCKIQWIGKYERDDNNTRVMKTLLYILVSKLFTNMGVLKKTRFHVYLYTKSVLSGRERERVEKSFHYL